MWSNRVSMAAETENIPEDKPARSRPKRRRDNTATAPQLCDEAGKQPEVQRLSAELEKLTLETAKLRADSGALARQWQELRKLAAEAGKAELERDRLRIELNDRSANTANDTTKRRQEAEKLALDIRNAQRTPNIEIAKAVVPALGLVVSVVIGLLTLSVQREKDQAAARATQLSTFSKDMTEPSPAKQKIAVAGVVSIGPEAVPVLVATIDTVQDYSVKAALHAAVLSLYKDANSRPAILQEVSNWVRLVAERRLELGQVDATNLEEYLKLLRQCLNQIPANDHQLHEWPARSELLVNSLKENINKRALDNIKTDVIKRIDAAFQSGGAR